ncbi:hypothetical protein GCM10009559_28860 [Pseudonocardia zijingensis]|uniref:Uncharacterized protein n=1 Tax=Pseudonocardia zijingensis TaxID=153376 RepID=A0ABN1Q387_9PSEU
MQLPGHPLLVDHLPDSRGGIASARPVLLTGVGNARFVEFATKIDGYCDEQHRDDTIPQMLATARVPLRASACHDRTYRDSVRSAPRGRGRTGCRRTWGAG